MQSRWLQTGPPSSSYLLTLTNAQVFGGASFGVVEDPLSASNRPPAFATVPATNARSGALYRYDASAVDANGDALVFDLTVRPVGMSVHPSSGVVVWVPGAEQVGTHAVVLRVQDGRGGVAAQAFTVVVREANHTPQITSQPTGPAVVGRTWQYQVRAQDADGNAISFRLEEGPTNMVLVGPPSPPPSPPMGARECFLTPTLCRERRGRRSRGRSGRSRMRWRQGRRRSR
jgi:hypothetical protein